MEEAIEAELSKLTTRWGPSTEPVVGDRTEKTPVGLGAQGVEQRKVTCRARTSISERRLFLITLMPNCSSLCNAY